jgi:hypothetical protein
LLDDEDFETKLAVQENHAVNEIGDIMEVANASTKKPRGYWAKSSITERIVNIRLPPSLDTQNSRWREKVNVQCTRKDVRTKGTHRSDSNASKI